MRRPATSGAAFAADQSIATPNITPLIDVMLVLLIVFIMSIPAMTHKVPIDLPQPTEFTKAVEQVQHQLDLSPAGVAMLDGVAMDGVTLTAKLHAINANPKAVLLMHTDPKTRYARFDEVLAQVKRAGVTRLGFAGNEGLAGSF